jgi:hypothetical protein
MASRFDSKNRDPKLRSELREDQHHLHELTLAIDELLSHPRIAENHWNDVQSLWGELRDQLSLHFALEEAEGYLNISRSANPECVCTAEYLKLQHAELFGEICAVAEAACDVESNHQRRVAATIARYRRFRSALDAHEEAEWNLIEEAWGKDLGVGD